MNDFKYRISKTLEDKIGPPKINGFAYLRCRKMHWQTEGNWHWSIIFTDVNAELQPTYIDPMGTFVKFNETKFGNNINEQGPNGPNE